MRANSSPSERVVWSGSIPVARLAREWHRRSSVRGEVLGDAGKALVTGWRMRGEHRNDAQDHPLARFTDSGLAIGGELDREASLERVRRRGHQLHFRRATG